jgi:L-glutamine-phosphate cytidylyltransferase
MKVIILVAGKGSRLGEPGLPKPLTVLANGKSILGQQLDHLSPYISLNQVILVVGYHKEMIMEQFPELLYVFNPYFGVENTSKSLLRALRKVEEDVLWLNGDVVFHPSVISSVLQSKSSCMVVNEGVVGEEEVKYRASSTGEILEISKQVQNAQGEALGINFFKTPDLDILREELENCQPGDYFEKGIEEGIKKGLKVHCCKVNSSHCTEIDFPEDLEHANQLMKGWFL